jgi:hypothetical protein
MTAPTKAVVPANERVRGLLDINSAKANKRFLDAYNTGRLDKLTPDEQSMFLFALALKLGVKAELGELMLYQGKPYITLAGLIRLAHNSGLFVGMTPRPATSLECRQYGVQDGDYLWVCDVYRRGAPRPFRGWGFVAKADRNPVAKQFPRELAKKRARYDALKIAFPPAEEISLMHQKYIEEAEAELRKHGSTGAQLATMEYAGTIEETAAEIEGPEGPDVVDPATGEVLNAAPESTPEPIDDPLADDRALVEREAAAANEPTQGALPLETKMRKASRNAIREGL